MTTASSPEIFIGCAGWSIPKTHADHFPSEGSHLERYAATFRAVEINSSFYRPHKPATYARWAATVPDGFRFAVKVPKQITHEKKLVNSGDLLQPFLEETAALGAKLGPLLVQMPPKLAFDREVAHTFFTLLRKDFAGEVVCEPRHRTWFAPDADKLLTDFHTARVAADPAVVPAAAKPGGWDGLVYYRLHGSPKIYYSSYSSEYLGSLANTLKQRSAKVPTWCIFDNTAMGEAIGNGVEVMRRLSSPGGTPIS